MVRAKREGYLALNSIAQFNSFKFVTGIKDIAINTYRRTVKGEATQFTQNVVAIYKFIAEELNKPFIEVASDLINKEWYGRKMTLWDTLKAENEVFDENKEEEYRAKLTPNELDFLGTTFLASLTEADVEKYNECNKIFNNHRKES